MERDGEGTTNPSPPLTLPEVREFAGGLIFEFFGAMRGFQKSAISEKCRSGELPRPFRKKIVAMSSRTTRSFQRHPDEPPFSSQLAKSSSARSYCRSRGNEFLCAKMGVSREDPMQNQNFNESQ